VGYHEGEVDRDKDRDKDLPEVLQMVVLWKDVQELEEGFVAESMALGMPGSKQEPEEFAISQGASRPNQ